jgi:glycosyltransferase involved in cell wall biosynthesis
MMVDVIIPAFNSAPWLRDAIESVLRQTCPPHRIIVVDDGSSDGTDSVLASYRGKIHLIRHESNRGLPAARNSGIKASASDLIAFLDADDKWTINKLQEQIAEFAGDDPPGLSYTSLIDCDLQLRPQSPPRRFKARKRESVFEELYMEAFPIPPSTVVVRRCVFDDCGLFNESMLKAQDYECWLRIAMKYTVSCLPKALCLRRGNPYSISSMSSSEKDAYYAFRAFDLCGETAAQAQVRLPMSVADRKILFLRRRYKDSIRWQNKEGEAFYKQKLLQAGAYGRMDQVLSVLLRIGVHFSGLFPK